MGLFQRKARCPTCGSKLQKRPKRKQKCPHCGNLILVRSGQLVTEKEASIADYLARIEGFGVSRRDFDSAEKELSKRFGQSASVNDTVWSILNQLVGRYASDSVTSERIYREMAALVSREGRDPTPYLVEAEQARSRWEVRREARPKRKAIVFLGHDELAYVRGLRKGGKLEEAEKLLLRAEPSPAVLDELRKNASIKAREAKKRGDWQAVVRHLEGYSAYARGCREECIKMVNQEPPRHTETDMKRLEEAKAKLAE